MNPNPSPSPAPVGNNKAFAAIIAGALTTLVVYGLSFVVTPPPEVTGAIQTLIAAAAVYYTPHGS